MNRTFILVAAAMLFANVYAYSNCEHDNCYLKIIDPQFKEEADPFCFELLSGNATAATAIPTSFNNCNGSVGAVSSACACHTHTLCTPTVTTKVEVSSTATPSSRPLEHWLYTSEIDDKALEILERPDIAGAQVLYSWRALEPEKDKYDFSGIKNDMQRLQVQGKKLWVQLQDRTFDANLDPVPRYMKVPFYNNGSAPTCDGENCEKNFTINGTVAQQWNPRVRERFQALLAAMAMELDGKIYGLNLAETSIAVNQNENNYTDEAYFRGQLENAGFAGSVFNQSFAVQYVNFWPGGWGNKDRFSESFEFYAKHGVGVGGPDLAPFRLGQLRNSYPFIAKYRNKVPITVMSVQEPTLNYSSPCTGEKYTKQEMVDFGADYLGASIIFWAATAPWLGTDGAS